MILKRCHALLLLLLLTLLGLLYAHRENAAAASGQAELPCIALTFDDGPSPQTTAALLDGLKELIRQTEPSEILVYGKTSPAMAALLREHSIPWQAFPHNMATRVRAREEAQ